MSVHFSSRVAASNLNPIADAQRRAKEQGIVLTQLNDSNPTHHGLAPAFLDEVYMAEPRGQHAARLALAEYLEQSTAGTLSARSVDPEHLYVVSSTSQAYAWLFKLLCNAGDAVLAPKPGYPLIESIASLECIQALNYQLQFDGSWTIDIPQIRAILDSEDGARVRALIVINPNNPTGSYVKPSERDELVALCAEHQIAIIADEVFFDYTLEPFDGNRRFAGETGVLTFALDGFSKTLAAPHAKVGWIEVSGPADDVREAQQRLDFIADDFLPMSALIADRMPMMLEAAPEQSARVRARVQANLRILHSMLAADELGVVDVLRAEGGWNVLLRMPSVIDENELVLHLIDTQHTSGQPGYFFDMTSNGYLALSLLPQEDMFRANVQHVLDGVRELLMSEE